MIHNTCSLKSMENIVKTNYTCIYVGYVYLNAHKDTIESLKYASLQNKANKTNISRENK